MKKKILFLLHIPPPIHGSSIMGQEIKNKFIINNSFECRFLNLLVNQKINESGKFKFVKLIQFCRIIFRLLLEIITERPDVCYFALTTTGIALYKDTVLVALLRLLRIERIYHLHNKGVSMNNTSKINNKLYRFVFSGANIILLSNFLYYDIEAFVPFSRVHICPNGITHIKNKINSLRLQNDAPVRILFLSNLIESKGVYILLEACKLLANKKMEFICSFAGSIGNVSEKDFNEKVQQLELENKVKYMGVQYGLEKELSLVNTDIFVHPSYHDCFPLVLLEAMQYSLPVVSTFEGGIPDLVENGVTGYLVPQKNAEALADKLEILIKNPELRAQMGKAGRIKFENEFTLDIFEHRLNEILHKILEKQ